MNLNVNEFWLDKWYQWDGTNPVNGFTLYLFQWYDHDALEVWNNFKQILNRSLSLDGWWFIFNNNPKHTQSLDLNPCVDICSLNN